MAKLSNRRHDRAVCLWLYLCRPFDFRSFPVLYESDCFRYHDSFGIFCLYQSITQKNDTPELLETPRFTDVLILGFVLAVNCIPPSLSAGVMSLSPIWVGFFSMLFSCLSIQVSVILGQKFLRCRFFRSHSIFSSFINSNWSSGTVCITFFSSQIPRLKGRY